MNRTVEKVNFPIPKQPKAKRVAAYARVSSGKDEMLHSLSAQISYYSELIQNHPGWLYCGVFSDEAFTGTKDNRTGFQSLISECRAGNIDLIITKSISRFESILKNEKYKGAARLQKKFTVDFLSKKMKINEGEVPQYYIENSHEAIIDPMEWDAVQDEFKRRKAIGRAYSGKSVFGAKIVCGDCGGFYGSKTWHSTDKYKTVIWQCNRKFKDNTCCKTPHITEDEIKARFLKVYNGLVSDKEPFIKACKLTRDVLTDTKEIDREMPELLRELEVVTELIKKCIAENSSSAQDQEKYTERYNSYVDRYEKAKSRYDEIEHQKENKLSKRKAIDRFISDLLKRDEQLTEFDNCLWLTVVDTVTVQSDGILLFKFNDGTEIKG